MTLVAEAARVSGKGTSVASGEATRPTKAQAEREDRRITEAATERLRMSLYRPLRVVHCECSGGVLTLAGRVPSFYHRQLAHAHVRDLAGVQRVVDQLQVVS